MNEDDERSNRESKIVFLTIGNFVAWMHYIMNRIKRLRSPQLEKMILTGVELACIPPTQSMGIMCRGQLQLAYTDDENGLEELLIY